MLRLHVINDIIITCNDSIEIQGLEEHLDQSFQVKRLGRLKYFLGIEFGRSSDRILMTKKEIHS